MKGDQTSQKSNESAKEAKKTIAETDKKTEEIKPAGNGWKGGFIAMSILAGLLLAGVIVLLMLPPKVVYVNDTSDSDDDDYSWFYNSDSSSSSSSSSSSNSTPADKKQEVTEYAAGEKVGSSTVGAAIEVEQVIRNYQGYPYNWGPEDNYEFVQVRLKFTNNSSNAIKLYSFDFCLEDSDGMIDSAKSSYYDTSTNYFPFSKEIAGGGTSVSGVMVFEVRKGSTNSLTLLYEKDTAKKRISIKL